MTDREKLIKLIDEAAELYPSELYAITDHLIANGVTVRKKEKTVKFLPCKCGKNSHFEWYVQGGGIFYECRYCGLKSPEGRSVNEARELWNEMIRSAERSKERPPEVEDEIL